MNPSKTNDSFAFYQTTDLTAIIITGSNGVNFLQGQLTVNIETLPSNRWRLLAFCSRQGRVLVSGFLGHYPAPDDGLSQFIWLVPTSLATQTITQLRRFILRSKVNLNLLSSPILIRQLNSSSSLLPLTEGAVTSDNNMVHFTLGGDNVLRVGLDHEQHLQSLSGFNRDTPPIIDNQRWRLLTIQRAVAWLDENTQDLFLPQFLNFDCLQAIDFDKGCYVGQEVIARLHYLGKIKKRCFIVCGEGLVPTTRTVVTDTNNKPVGEIINSINDESITENKNRYWALAVIDINAIEATLYVNSSVVNLPKMPYDLAPLTKHPLKISQ